MGILIVTEEEQWEVLPKETINVAIILEERLVLTDIGDVLKAFVLLMGLLYIINKTQYSFDVLKTLHEHWWEQLFFACLRATKHATLQKVGCFFFF